MKIKAVLDEEDCQAFVYIILFKVLVFQSVDCGASSGFTLSLYLRSRLCSYTCPWVLLRCKSGPFLVNIIICPRAKSLWC